MHLCHLPSVFIAWLHSRDDAAVCHGNWAVTVALTDLSRHIDFSERTLRLVSKAVHGRSRGCECSAGALMILQEATPGIHASPSFVRPSQSLLLSCYWQEIHHTAILQGVGPTVLLQYNQTSRRATSRRLPPYQTRHRPPLRHLPKRNLPAQTYLKQSTSTYPTLQRLLAHSNPQQRSINVIIAVACLLFITICIGIGGWVYYVRRRKAATRATSKDMSSRDTVETRRAASPTSSIAGLISPDESVLHEPTAFYASRMVRSRDSQLGHPPVEEV